MRAPLMSSFKPCFSEAVKSRAKPEDVKSFEKIFPRVLGKISQKFSYPPFESRREIWHISQEEGVTTNGGDGGNAEEFPPYEFEAKNVVEEKGARGEEASSAPSPPPHHAMIKKQQPPERVSISCISEL